jgi:hypothetical protein
MGHASPKIVILSAWRRGGVMAGYDKNSWSEVRGKILDARFAKFPV